MRLDLLRHGNFHGVSSNWLSKNLQNIYESPRLLAEKNHNNWDISIKHIERGEKVYREVIGNFSGGLYGNSYDCESGLASFLYAYILKMKPKVIVETGVANGITTNVIMSALEETGGELHSFDIDKRCENAYTGRGKWHFHLMNKSYPKSLMQISSTIDDIELWIHDSNHGYLWQTFEYRFAFERLNTGGLLVSDDIDSSPAFGRFAIKNKPTSTGIFDKRKFFGIIQK
jgi:hypothetical protein